MKSLTPGRARFLMCPPEHFDVHYRINPWMAPEEWRRRSIDLVPSARAGWTRLVHALQGLGAEVRSLPPQPALPDLVFTANAAVVLDGVALLATFRHPERQAEEPHFKAFFRELESAGEVGRIVAPEPGLVFEGAGDCLWDPCRQLFWVGYGQRSDEAGVDLVQATFGRPAVALELADPRYYHLDTCLCPLEGGHVVYVPEAFRMESLRRIFAHVPESMRIAVRHEDAAQLAANAACVGRNVVLSKCSPQMRTTLESVGYRVHEVDIPEFSLSGGSVACLTLRLDRCSDGAGARMLA